MTTTEAPVDAGAALLEYAQVLRRAADQLLTHDLEGVDAETTIRIAHELSMARKAIGAAEEFVAKHAAAVWPSEWATPLDVGGVGRAHPYRTKARTHWQHEDLTKAVIDRHLADAEGEIPDPYTVVRWVTDAAAVSYWRVGVLRGIGVDVSEYRETVPGTLKLNIQTGDEIGATTSEGAA